MYLSFSKRKDGARVLGALGTGLRTERRTNPTPHPPFFFSLSSGTQKETFRLVCVVALHNSEPLFLLHTKD